MSHPSKINPPTVDKSWHKPTIAAYVTILITFGGGAGWATITKIDSAAIAEGVVMAQSNKKTVQHLEGGIVREIRVRDGDQVKEGDLLLRLDDTQSRAALETIRNQKIASRVKEARLIAEREHQSTISIPSDLISFSHSDIFLRAMQDQNNNMRERGTYLKSQIDVLNAKITQIQQEIKGLANDAESTKQQIETINLELRGLRELLAKQLVPLSRVAALERERIRLQGILERAGSDSKKGLQSIQETNLMIIQLENQFQQQISSDIIDVRRDVADLFEKERVAKDVMARLDVKAPRTGIIQAMKFFTVGAVIRPGDNILEIAPTEDKLTVNVKISPNDIDAVTEGLQAEVRFPTYHSRRVPFMFGYIASVSYDRLVDQQNNNMYFQGEVAIDASTIPSDLKQKLKPGIPSTVIIKTGEQAPVDYFLGPLFDRLGRGLREK